MLQSGRSAAMLRDVCVLFNSLGGSYGRGCSFQMNIALSHFCVVMLLAVSRRSFVKLEDFAWKCPTPSNKIWICFNCMSTKSEVYFSNIISSVWYDVMLAEDYISDVTALVSLLSNPFDQSSYSGEPSSSPRFIFFFNHLVSAGTLKKTHIWAQ